MNSTQLTNFLQFAIQNKFPVMITGKPGIGKTSIVEQASEAAGADLIVSHPVVSDPTDYKGLPFPGTDGTAHFLPFGELNRLIQAEKPTVFFLDDLGQAPSSVQAGCMNLILARRINGHIVSPYVTFMAATNRREDKAGVNGILEPVKSRFCSIIGLEVNTDDWVRWALNNNMPVELISFIRFRPATLEEFTASKDMTNSATPRTVAQAGRLQAAGLAKDLEFEVFKGAAGEAFAAEYTGFLRTFRNLPDIDAIILAPETAPVPDDAAVLYAISGALAHHANTQNLAPIIKYLNRLPGEIAVATMKDTVTRNAQEITSTKAFLDWAANNHSLIC